ncbi:MAG: hypothetical protein AAF235_06615, partial [Planctomycetota bacterium]
MKMKTNQAAGTMRKRGSALIIAIGTLSVIAVLAAIYVTIGKGDQQTAIAVQQQRSRDDVSQQFANRITQVIADDRLDTYLEPTASGDQDDLLWGQRLVREVFDYPFTDHSVISSPLNADGEIIASLEGLGEDTAADREAATALASRARFNASGRHTVPAFELGGGFNGAETAGALHDVLSDPRVASDPWLASTEPWFAGGSFEERVYSRTPGGAVF